MQYPIRACDPLVTGTTSTMNAAPPLGSYPVRFECREEKNATGS